MKRGWYLPLVLLISIVSSSKQTGWIPCIELKRDLQVPCKCSVSTEYSRSIEMNCDRAIFTRDNVDSLREEPIVSFSQRNSGYQNLPEDLLESANLNLRKLDLSGNSIHRLMGRALRAQTLLTELKMADNLLGDNLNPIFSSNEFHGMKELRLLDLSRNGLRSIEEGIFKGCDSLEQLYLDGNNLTAVPTMSLKGPKSIRVLSLSGNNIASLPRAAFSMIGDSLLRLDLSDNELSHMEDDALSGLEQLLLLNISHNDLGRFNSDVFKGAYNLLQLDLSANFLQEFPSDALRHLTDLKFLNVSNNLITEIERVQLTTLKELQVLDLSRNNIGRLGANTFSDLSSLARLDLSLNVLRTVEESSFDGLTELKWLSLQDNNILLVPGTALARLPSLTHLHMEFNRIAALSTELIKPTSSSLVRLALTRNLMREIPAGLFRDFENLIGIELSGNMLSSISSDTFSGLEDTLLDLDVSFNRLTSIGELALKKLISLNLAGNRLTRIRPETFAQLRTLEFLNLSSNPLYGGFPPVFPSSLLNLDVSRTGLKILPAILFRNLESIERISIAGNRLERIEEATFNDLRNLSRIDLSGNRLELIENGAFVGLIGLYELNLRGNRLSSFAGEHFDTGTGLEILDLSDNRIERFSPTAFAIHPRLRELDLSGNRLVYLPTDYLKPSQFLEGLRLARNSLRRIDEFAFSQLGRLRDLNLAANRIESVDELAFHNSTQLQLIDLSENVIETLSERTLEGLLRLEHLNLRDNRLNTLPDTIFEPSRVRTVESIDLAGNRINEIPIVSLRRQSGSLSSLNLARNRMVELFDQDIPGNLKDLDLSDNPLSENAINRILGEAKILRSLNLANTGVKRLVRLETPFLKRLNLSGNDLTNVPSDALERTTMLQSLDLSRNNFSDFQSVIGTLKRLPVLRWLDVSGNDAGILNETSFDGLNGLRFLNLSDLPTCTRIEKNVFKPLPKLRSLSAYSYPKLGYFDLQGILKGMNGLETLDVEVKDSSVSNEQLSIRSHPRLKELTLRGERLKNLMSSSLVGVRGPTFFLGLKNTSIDSIPASLFFPVPRSTRLELDVSGSKFTTLSAQFLAALDERTGFVKINGLQRNPINCDCDARQLWKWLKTNGNGHASSVLCAAPPHLRGAIFTNLTEDRLSCSNFSFVSSSLYDQSGDRVPASNNLETTLPSVGHASGRSTLPEPDIIWTVAPTVRNSDRNKHYNEDRVLTASPGANASGTDDTLIIGIVGGVVAFIAFIVLVICVCRFKWSGRIEQARLAALATSSIPDVSMIRGAASTYSGKINHDIYVGSYNGSTLDRGNGPIVPPVPTTPVQMMPYVQPPIHLVHTLLPPTPQSHSHSQSQLQAQQFYGYCDAPSLPMYIACPTDTKCDR
ncbi:protein artichoke [Osmia bicornis bicornis]|uniref:protein artichoke n=1 Tax=Osmia bicornis bicornis TaxID=1437191 RepID=UPI001EAF1FAE|nr:protein artichoke [Osmia bicornis bicornis]